MLQSHLHPIRKCLNVPCRKQFWLWDLNGGGDWTPSPASPGCADHQPGTREPGRDNKHPDQPFSDWFTPDYQRLIIY